MQRYKRNSVLYLRLKNGRPLIFTGSLIYASSKAILQVETTSIGLPASALLLDLTVNYLYIRPINHTQENGGPLFLAILYPIAYISPCMNIFFSNIYRSVLLACCLFGYFSRLLGPLRIHFLLEYPQIKNDSLRCLPFLHSPFLIHAYFI